MKSELNLVFLLILAGNRTHLNPDGRLGGRVYVSLKQDRTSDLAEKRPSAAIEHVFLETFG